MHDWCGFGLCELAVFFTQIGEDLEERMGSDSGHQDGVGGAVDLRYVGGSCAVGCGQNNSRGDGGDES